MVIPGYVLNATVCAPPPALMAIHPRAPRVIPGQIDALVAPGCNPPLIDEGRKGCVAEAARGIKLCNAIMPQPGVKRAAISAAAGGVCVSWMAQAAARDSSEQGAAKKKLV